ncbi:RNA polymerase sigma factor [Micromonospora carbonacea]|uniref:RNA polymerase sigma factor n=1 Tax=Micromonospora carbonacea TaxID=47853 RepID=UPI0037178147
MSALSGPAEPCPPSVPPQRARLLMRWCLDCGAIQAKAGKCGSCGGWYETGGLLFEDLYEAYALPLRRFVRRLAADRGIPESLVDTEGVVHDTFVILLSGSGQPIRNPAAWLFTVARNQLNKAAAAQRRIAPGEPADHLNYGETTWVSLASPMADAEDIRMARKVMQAIAGLPGHQRIATYLRQVEGWSLAEVGAYLDCAASTAGVHISRGTTKVRESLFAGHVAFRLCAPERALLRDRSLIARAQRFAAWLASGVWAGGGGVLVMLTIASALSLGMSWWLAAVAALVVMVVASILWYVGWWLGAGIDARHRQRRFNRWLKTGRPLGPPVGTRRR